MGLLDDAIREHLELKRRSGAQDAEITRLETEAFGAGGAPPRPEPVDEAEPEPMAGEAEPEPFVEPDPVTVEEVPAAVARDAPPPPAPADAEPWLDEPDEVPPVEALQHRRQPTTEFTPEEAAAAVGDLPESEYVAPDEEPAEDLLEETPEFLQETPEHDRLWFEQKPPRDFDFGG